jgi:replicative DNA helicase
MNFSKVDPHSLEAEQAVIGCVLLTEGAINEFHELSPDSFYHTFHGFIWEALTVMASAGEPIDMLSIVHRLRCAGDLEKAGGASYISSMSNQVPDIAHAKHYAKIVTVLHERRKVLRSARQLEADILAEEEIDEAMFRFRNGVEQSGEVEGLATIRDVLPGVMRDVEDAFTRGTPPGIELGWYDLDGIYRMQPGDLVVVAGRPGMGKTAFALEIARRASKSGSRVLFVSLEMTKKELVKRMLCQAGRIRSETIRTGRLHHDDYAKFTMACGQLSESNLDIWDRGGISSATIRSLAMRKRFNGGVDLIVVDYLQKVREHGYGDKKHLEHGHTIQALKDLAKAAECPVVALSQLNRQVDSRKDQEPNLSDLKGSGDIEQEADLAILLLRPEYYLKDQTPADLQGVARVIIEKNRHGRTGEVRLKWNGEFFRFENMDRAGY